MIARELETILGRQFNKIHISGQDYGHVSARFESLRGSNLLPKGRVKNSQHLSNEQIVSGILSLIAPQVGFSALTAIVIRGLRPVGGIEASFFQADTFSKAIEYIISNPDSLDLIQKISISDSEIYTNGYGRAAIYYQSNGLDKVAYYIGETACSLMIKGAEEKYNPNSLASSVVNEHVFYPSFFRPIIRKIQYEASMPRVVYPEEPETNEELEKKKRAEYLRIKPSSRFLNLAVDCQVTWPKEETLVEFDGHHLILMPKTKEHTTSIHIDLHGNKVSQDQAFTIINRFLSLLSWCDDQYAVLQEGWSGNPVPVPVSKRDLAFSTAHNWLFVRTLPEENVQKAIAIYREGRNAEQNFLVSYSVLSYYKILEIKFNQKKDPLLVWLKESYSQIRDEIDTNVIKRFEAYCKDKSIEDYLYGECRSAVAHAKDPVNSINPDDFEELSRLHNAAYILRQLARHFIKVELELSDHYFDGT